jgi:hemin uptake protein HemP
MAEPGASGTAPRPKDAAAEDQPPAYQSRDLFQDGKVVLIVHDGREYRLRITHAGKLLLTA